jgi:hypothetical protein
MSTLIPSRTGFPVFGFSGASYGALTCGRPIWYVHGTATGSTTGDFVAETTQYVPTSGVQPIELFTDSGANFCQVDTQNDDAKIIVCYGEYLADPSGWLIFSNTLPNRAGTDEPCQLLDFCSVRGSLVAMWTDKRYVLWQQSKAIGRKGILLIYDLNSFRTREYPTVITESNTPAEQSKTSWEHSLLSAVSKMPGARRWAGKPCPWDDSAGQDGQFQIYPIMEGTAVVAYRIVNVSTGQEWVVSAKDFTEWKNLERERCDSTRSRLLNGITVDTEAGKRTYCLCGRTDAGDGMCCSECTGVGCKAHTIECHQMYDAELKMDTPVREGVTVDTCGPKP